MSIGQALVWHSKTRDLSDGFLLSSDAVKPSTHKPAPSCSLCLTAERNNTSDNPQPSSPPSPKTKNKNTPFILYRIRPVTIDQISHFCPNAAYKWSLRFKAQGESEETGEQGLCINNLVYALWRGSLERAEITCGGSSDWSALKQAVFPKAQWDWKGANGKSVTAVERCVCLRMRLEGETSALVESVLAYGNAQFVSKRF